MGAVVAEASCGACHVAHWLGLADAVDEVEVGATPVAGLLGIPCQAVGVGGETDLAVLAVPEPLFALCTSISSCSGEAVLVL